MGVIYRHEFKSYDDTDWKLDIHKTGYSGAVNTFDCGYGGFKLSRNSTNNDRIAPILGSEVTVFALSQDSTFDGMLSDMLLADEETFYLVIYKDGVFWWAGVLLLDLYEEADAAYPKSIDLVFTDGIGRIKNIDYNNDGVAYTGKATIIEHIWNCLNKIPTAQFWSGSDIMLKTAVSYWETQMTYSATADPLPLARLDHESFYTIETNGDYKYKTAYEVLENLAVVFYSRLWLGDGAFNFLQIDNFRNASFTVFNYEKDGVSSVSNTTISPRQTVDQTDSLARLNGGSYQSYAGLKKVDIKYEHKSSNSFLPSPLVLNAGTESLGNVDDNGGDATFLIDGALSVTITNTTSTGVLVRLRLRLKQGSYYLRRDATNAGQNADYNGITWETGAYDIQIWTHATPGNSVKSFQYAVKFETPNLLNDGDFELSLETVNAIDTKDTSGNPVSAGVSATGQLSAFIEYKTDSEAENIRLFEADNSAVGSFSKSINLKTAYFGDAINSSTKTALEVYDGASWERSSIWRRGNSGTARKLLSLLCEDILAGQRTGLKKFVGSIRGSISFYDVLSINGDLFVFLSGAMTASSGVWDNAELFKIGYDSGGIILNVIGEGAGVNTPSLSFNFGSETVFDSTTSIDVQTADVGDENGNVSIGPQIGGTNNINLGGGLDGDTLGTGVIAIGVDSGINNTGDYNNFIGYQSGYNNTTGANNNFIGLSSGYSNTTGVGGSFIGYRSGFSNTTGHYNTFIGYQSGYNNSTGNYNTFISRNSGFSNTTGNYNTFISRDSGYSNTTGIGGNFLGYQSGYNNTTGNYNNFLGYQSGYNNTTGSNNNFVGLLAGYSNTTGVGGVFIGYRSGFLNTTGHYNTFIGHQSGYNNSTGTYNNFISRDSGYSNTTGSGSNFIGYQSGYNNTTGNYNNFLGYQSGYNNITGSNNNFIGLTAGYSNTTGVGSVFIGYRSGFLNTAGGYNVFVGNLSGNNNTTGSNSIVIGNAADSNNYSNSLVLGQNAQSLGANTVTIGASSNNLGTLTNESLTSNSTWSVVINGVSCKILIVQ